MAGVLVIVYLLLDVLRSLFEGPSESIDRVETIITRGGDYDILCDIICLPSTTKTSGTRRHGRVRVIEGSCKSIGYTVPIPFHIGS